METNELRNIWIEIEGVLTPKSKDELKEILFSKTKRILKKFKWLLVISISLCVGIITFLIIATLNHKSDILYIVNNSILAILIIILFGYYIKSYKKIYLDKNKEYNVYDSLNNKVQFLSKALKSKFRVILIPLLGILLILTVNVFFSSRSYIEALLDEENLWGLAFGFSIGVLVAFYFARKIAKHQKKELEIMKNYLKELKSV